MSFRRPGVALGLVMVMFGLEQFLQTRAAIFVERSSLINVGIGLVLLVSASCWLFNNLRRIKLDIVHVLALVLTAYAFLSQYWTISPNDYYAYLRPSLPYFILFLGLAPIISLDKKGMKQGIWTALILGMPLVILLVFLVTWEGRGIRMATPIMFRGQMSYSSPPLALATMAAQTGILAIILVPKNKLFRMLQFGVFALSAYIAYRTQSRGQLLTLGAVTLLCYPLANQGTKLKGMLYTILGLGFLAVLLYFVFSSFDLGKINRWNDQSITSGMEGRAEMAEVLLTKWSRSSPGYILFGLGANSSFKVSGFYVHNLPVEILGEYGIIGACLFIAIYVRVFTSSMKILKKLEHYPDMRREAVLVIALFMFSTVISLKEGSFYSWPHLFFFAIAISHMERHSRQFVAKQASLRQVIASSFANNKVPSSSARTR